MGAERIDMKYMTEEISWKGIGDYLSAARTLEAHGSSNTSGPRIHCQGLALELALKLHLWRKNAAYPCTHDLEVLAFTHCSDIQLTAGQRSLIQELNREYLHDGNSSYPARYRPSGTRGVVIVAQTSLEDLVASVVQSTSQADLVQRILRR